MPNLIEKLKRGHTRWQTKARDKRFKRRKSEIEKQLGAAAVQLEYQSLDGMLAAFNQDGAPFVPDASLTQQYILDWRRKERHGGTQTWYALCDLGQRVETVVWTYTTRDSKGGLMNGGKVYDMTRNAVEVLESALNLI